jgi:8-oxo-dGTP pyrophosphatase MutT (NUDIX family)
MALAGHSPEVGAKGESIEQCAYRETFEETGIRVGSVGRLLMRRVCDDGDGDNANGLDRVDDLIAFPWTSSPPSTLASAQGPRGRERRRKGY